MRPKLLLVLVFVPFTFWSQSPGQLDTSFDGDGKAFATFASSQYHNWSRAVAADASRVYVAGSANNGMGTMNILSCIAYNLNGTPDSSFAANGKFMLSWPITTSSTDIEIQPDGKIIFFGRDLNHLLVVRLNHDGTMDNTWAQDGIAELDITTATDNSSRMALQQDGKLIISGECQTINPQLFVARFDKDGLLDSSFGTDGIYKFTMPHYSGYLRNLIIQPDDKIIISFDEGIQQNNLCHLLRLTEDGVPDTTFNTIGYVLHTGQEGYSAIALAEDGAIFAARTQNQMAVIDRFGSDGQLDTNFSSIINFRLFPKDMFLTNGKIVVLGYTGKRPFTPITTEDYAAVALNIDGSIDTNFGTSGIAWVDMGTEYDTALQGAVQPDGKLLITGNYGGNGQFAVCRLIGLPELNTQAFENTIASLYPNPSFDGRFNINMGKMYRHVSVKVTNNLGQQIKAQDFYSSETIEMHIEKSGIYLVTLVADEQTPITLKLIR